MKKFVFVLFCLGPVFLTSFACAQGAAQENSAVWFDKSMTPLLIIILFLCSVMIYFIETGKRGKVHYIRKIAGLDAVEDAIGRATEMGRPILYINGTQDMDNVQTLAGLNILGMISKKVAEYDTPLYVPTSRSLVMTTAREVVKEAYSAAGRPNSFQEKNIFYISDEQFGFAAGVSGLIMREKPAACFFLGLFYAESLLLAEMGNSVGAIQIAGTAESSQLPFFVASCDYTLIGEELFAASAYLSQSPHEIGSLKGQDVGKFFAMLVIAVGSVLSTIAAITASPTIEKIVGAVIKFFTL